MTSRDSLDMCFNDMLKQADKWAAADYAPSTTRGESTEIEREQTERSSELEHHCFDDLTRAISSHITDMLMQRLQQEQNRPSSTKFYPFPSPQSSEDSLKREGRTTSRIPRPVSRPPSRAPSRPTTPSRDKRGTVSQCSSRYGSQTKLSIYSPPKRENETPLENRASRLRRESVNRKRSESAAPSPVPFRRQTLSTSRNPSRRGSQDQLF